MLVHFSRAATALGLLALASCSSSPRSPTVEVAVADLSNSESVVHPPPSLVNAPTSGTESFSSAAYGVAASPRVASGSSIKRGGGYRKVGSSYVVKGKRYRPTTAPKKSETGKASWYGQAFHGRTTANGEIFDMTHLTAAHKTMPLPSYARVTNLKNGRSVIVRVNDRGPFSNNRVIDLSKRAAQVLDFIQDGTAQVRVEYAGEAPLHGQDDEFLIASMKNVPGVTPQRARNPIRSIFASVRPPASVPDRPVGPLVSSYASMRVQNAFYLSATGTGDRMQQFKDNQTD